MAEKYIGIDINDKFAMVSQYTHGMSEPGTFSMVRFTRFRYVLQKARKTAVLSMGKKQGRTPGRQGYPV